MLDIPQICFIYSGVKYWQNRHLSKLAHGINRALLLYFFRTQVGYKRLKHRMALETTLNRWVIDYAPLMAAAAKKRKRAVATSWRMDETYVKIKGQRPMGIRVPCRR
jgi:transposase-like protein